MFDPALERRIRIKLPQEGRERHNGYAIHLPYVDGVFINPLAHVIKDKFIRLLKPKVLVSIQDNEQVWGVAGKCLKEAFIRLDENCYWIVERFLRIEWDEYSYRIYKHEFKMTDELGKMNYKLGQKSLFESNWNKDVYPKNEILKRIIEEIKAGTT